MSQQGEKKEEHTHTKKCLSGEISEVCLSNWKDSICAKKAPHHYLYRD
jgi:hypothetical protein